MNVFTPVLGQTRAPRSKVVGYQMKVWSRKYQEEIYVRGVTQKTDMTEVWCGWEWVPMATWVELTTTRRTWFQGQLRRRGLV